MNRLQTKLAIVLISRKLFVEAEKIKFTWEEASQLVKIIYEEESEFWINVIFF